MRDCGGDDYVVFIFMTDSSAVQNQILLPTFVTSAHFSTGNNYIKRKYLVLVFR